MARRRQTTSNVEPRFCVKKRRKFYATLAVAHWRDIGKESSPEESGTPTEPTWRRPGRMWQQEPLENGPDDRKTIEVPFCTKTFAAETTEAL